MVSSGKHMGRQTDTVLWIAEHEARYNSLVLR